MRFGWGKRRSPSLPEGRQFALTWEIPDNFGGLTKAMLQRSAAFAEVAGTPVSILTFRLQPELDGVRTDLRARGLLGDGVTIHNLWEDLRSLPDDILSGSDVDPHFADPGPFETAADETLIFNGEEFARLVLSGDQTLVEVVRPDRTVLARQVWSHIGDKSRLCEFGDRVDSTALYARDGSFIGGWRGSWGLWQFWMSLMMTDSDYAIIDSSVIADAMTHNGHSAPTSLYLFHNNHLTRHREPAYAPLDGRRRYVSEHHAHFDANIFLTDAQRLDFDKLMGSARTTHTVANVVTVAEIPRVERIPGRGVVLARFSSQKRLDHALRAVASAAESSPGLHLDLFGSGPREQQLRQLAAELAGPITFHSHTESPAREFAGSSFSLLSSTNEGLPLSIIESMAAGCVPIAYDVPYGPSDLITHGIDGFLVPAGDQRAMARQITEFLALDQRVVAKMRKAGKKRARDYEAEPVIAKWAEVMTSARSRYGSRRSGVDADILSAQEKRAAFTRFAPTTTHSELLEADWLNDSRLCLTVRVHLSGGFDGGAGDRELLAKLIHRPTGTAHPVSARPRTDLDRAEDRPSCRYVSVEIDLNDLPEALDHSLLLGLGCDGDQAWDVIRERRDVRDWLAFPAVSASRPVLLFSKKRGVVLASAAPKVAATATVDGETVTFGVEPIAGTVIERVQAVGLKGSPTIECTMPSPGQFVLELPEAGFWELKATLDGATRLVAWAPDSAALESINLPTRPIALGVSPRGYLRITRTAPTEAEQSP